MDKKQNESSIELNASKILKQQFNDIINNPISNIGISIGLINDDIFTWNVTLLGAKDTSYRNGIFFLKIIFPENFPQGAPDIIFLTPIYHLNVNPIKFDNPGAEKLGHVSVSITNWWKPSTTIREMLTKLFTVFYMANPDSPYVLDIANEFRDNRLLYEEKVKYFTKKYASPGNKLSRKGYDKTWDFSISYNKDEVNIDNNYNIQKSNTNNYNNKENDLKEKELKEKELKENQLKENDLINIKFIYNGKEKIEIQCNKNELIKDLIEKFKNKLNINDDKHFFILYDQKLNPKLYVGQAGLNNNSTIDVIDTRDIEYS